MSNGRYFLDMEEIAEKLCDGCPMVSVETFTDAYGLIDSPDEKHCPVDFFPELEVQEECLVCKVREAAKYLEVA